MELELFNKINLTLQFVYESFTSFRKKRGEFNSYYNGYDRTLVENQPAAPDILSQFQDVIVRDLFQPTHLQNNHYGDKYLSIPAARFSEERVGVHEELIPYLFYYLANSLQNEIQGFLNLVRSPEFREDMHIDLTIENGVLSYSADRHNLITNYIQERIPTYNRMFNLLNQTTRFFIALNTDRPYFEIKLKDLDEILKVIDERYNFDAIVLT